MRTNSKTKKNGLRNKSNNRKKVFFTGNSSNINHFLLQVHSYLTAALSDYNFDHIDQNYIYTIM